MQAKTIVFFSFPVRTFHGSQFKLPRKRQNQTDGSQLSHGLTAIRDSSPDFQRVSNPAIATGAESVFRGMEPCMISEAFSSRSSNATIDHSSRIADHETPPRHVGKILHDVLENGRVSAWRCEWWPFHATLQLLGKLTTECFHAACWKFSIRRSPVGNRNTSDYRSGVATRRLLI